MDKKSSYKEESECHNVKESLSDEELGEETNNLEQMDSMEPLATTRSDTTGKFIFARIVFNMSPHCIIVEDKLNYFIIYALYSFSYRI